MTLANESWRDAFTPEDPNPSSPTRRGELLQAERSLRQNEEIFRLLVESLRDHAIFMLDLDGHVATWNLGAERIKGYRAEEVLGQHFSLFYPEEAKARHWPEHVLAVAASEGRFEDEGWRVRKDGSLFWANVVITAIFDRGRLCGFSKVTRDLTERKRTEEELRQARDLLERRVEERTEELTKANARLQTEIEERRQAEQALRQSEQRVSSLMALMPVGVYMCEAPSGIIRYYNRCAAELWGREPQIGDTDQKFCGAYRLFWPDGTPLPHAETPMAQVLAGAPAIRSQKVVIERPDGTRILALVNIDPMISETGQVVGAINVFQDVTVRERLFEELRESEERFRRLVFALPAAVYTTDREGRITLFNENAVELWGRQPEIGKDLWCGSFRILRPDGTPLPHEECPMALTLRDGVAIRGQEILVERPDGCRFFVLPYPELLHNSAGEIVGAINMLIDISDRRQSEEELRRRSETIEQLIRELAAADRKKDEFLATLAHELRNPLAPILSSLQVLHLAKDDPVVQRQAHSVIDRQVRQMVRLVDDLLDIARITSNKLQLRRQKIDLSSAIQNALETTRPLIEQSGHKLTVTCPAEPVHLEADPTRISQVLTNLLNNSAKYTESGGHIWLAVERKGSEVVISVRDTGIGIAADHLLHLFEMFSQSTPALERSGGGLGVGLALVRGIVELHNGTVEAHSDGPGKGSQFIVRLPITSSVPPAQSGNPQDHQIMDHETGKRLKARILITDDNHDAAESLGLLLELAGHEIHLAHNGLESMQAAETFLPDVALLDIGMPQMNGYELARYIRAQPWGASMILVAITGWGQEQDKKRSLEAGFDYHLTKPVDFSEISKLLLEIIERKQVAG
jgi:PAS domain S-box-containing protein